MKTTNKVLAIVLSVMLIMSVLPFAAFAGNTLTVATGADLKTAVANAEDGDTIQFTADITFTAAQVGFKVDKDITFDLNGCTLAGPANGSVGKAVDPLNRTEVMFVVGTSEDPVNVTFKDSVGGGSWTMTYTGTSQAFFCDIRDYANVTVESGEYILGNCKGAGALFYTRTATTTLDIEDGTFSVSADMPSGKRGYLAYVSNGSAEINGGTFNASKSSDYVVTSNQNRVVVINGGEFNGSLSGSSNASTESGKSIVINGGTFNDYTGETVKDVTAYIADDVVQDASGTIVPVEATTVAKIGNDQYATVAAAVAAAPTDGTKTTIKLIADSTSTKNIGVYGGTWSARTGGKNIVLDLNGHTYTQNNTSGTGAFVLAPSQDLSESNSLTITDTSAAKNGKVTSNTQYTTVQVGSNCNFTLTAGTIENTGSGTALQISGTGKANINNGTVAVNDDAYAIYMYEASGNTTPSLKIKNGTISGYAGIYAAAEATVDMTGGTIDADYAFIVDEESTVNVTGGTIDATYVGYNYTDDATISISGGTFTSEVPLEYCAEDFIPVDNGDGTYGVREVDANNGSSLTLDDGVGLNVYLDADAYGVDVNEAVVEVTYNHNADVSKQKSDSTDVIPLSEATKYIKLGDPYSGDYKFSFKMAPAQFAEDVKIELYTSAQADQPVFSATTSVKAKCDEVINLAKTNANYASFAALCGALEDYCVASQVYFSYDAPATVTYNNEAVTTMDAADMNVPTASVGIDAAGYSFTIVSGLEVNIFFEGELSVTGVSIDSTKGTNLVKAATTLKGGKSCINIKGIASGNIDNLITVTTTEGNITLAATNIAKAIAASSNNINYGNLARALYLYSVQASAYFNC